MKCPKQQAHKVLRKYMWGKNDNNLEKNISYVHLGIIFRIDK